MGRGGGMRRLSLMLDAAASLLVCAHEGWAGSTQAGPPTPPPVQTIDLSTDLFSATASSSPEPEVSVSYAELVVSGGAPAGREVAAVRARTCEMWGAPGGLGSAGS